MWGDLEYSDTGPARFFLVAPTAPPSAPYSEERGSPSERIFFEVLLFINFPGADAMTDAVDTVSPAVADFPAAAVHMRNEQRPQGAVFCLLLSGQVARQQPGDFLQKIEFFVLDGPVVDVEVAERAPQLAVVAQKRKADITPDHALVGVTVQPMIFTGCGSQKLPVAEGELTEAVAERHLLQVGQPDAFLVDQIHVFHQRVVQAVNGGKPVIDALVEKFQPCMASALRQYGFQLHEGVLHWRIVGGGIAGNRVARRPPGAKGCPALENRRHVPVKIPALEAWQSGRLHRS